MRGPILLACAGVALASTVACVESVNDEPLPPETTPPPGWSDAAPADAGSEASGPKGPATCSGAGWCVTPLPDADLKVIDVWPLPGRAFAVVESAILGVKVMEWVDADGRWTYIDDNTQNDDGFGKYVGRIWAPSDSEIYYTVYPGYVYHGQRTDAWKWERSPLVVSAVPDSIDQGALGVWGTSADDVYAWYGNTIFHRKSGEGGVPAWVPEYEGTVGPVDRVMVYGAGGSSKDDLWFGGSRNGMCPVLLRRELDAYRIVVDGTGRYGDRGGECFVRDGALLIDWQVGWLTDIHPDGNGGIVAFRAPDAVTRIAPDGAGYTIATTTFPSPVSYLRTGFFSLWKSSDDVWLSGKGLLLYGPMTSSDAGAYAISTVALTGAPLEAELRRVRGTDDNNLWAVGARYALHKTTP